MKVVLISGSPKANGNTAQILTACAQVIEDEGLETQLISFAGKKIESCVACGACAKAPCCSLNDGFNEILEQIREADGLIVGAPVYFGTARGDVMSFLQRLGMVSRKNGNFLANMVGGPIAVGRRGGQTATIQEMLMFYFINGMIVPGSNYWNILFGQQPGEAMADEEGVATAKLFAQNVASLILKTRG